MDEQKLIELARRAGEDAERGLDTNRVAASVLARLGQPAEERPTVPARRIWVRVVSVAAVLMLLIGSSLFLRGGVEPTVPVPAQVGPIALDDLTNDELSVVLDSLAFDAPVSQVHADGLDDLSEAELRELLVLMEG